MQNYLIKFLETSINSFKIYVSPSLNDLTKDDLHIKLNNANFSDFKFERVGDSEYKITPTNTFSIYDEISIFIKNTNIISNSLVICLCKLFNNGSEVINYTLPDLESGIYTITTETLNELDFNISTEPITICNGINNRDSSLTAEAYDSENKVLPLTIKLLDASGAKVPPGGYIINFKYEKI